MLDRIEYVHQVVQFITHPCDKIAMTYNLCSANDWLFMSCHTQFRACHIPLSVATCLGRFMLVLNIWNAIIHMLSI